MKTGNLDDELPGHVIAAFALVSQQSAAKIPTDSFKGLPTVHWVDSIINGASRASAAMISNALQKSECAKSRFVHIPVAQAIGPYRTQPSQYGFGTFRADRGFYKGTGFDQSAKRLELRQAS